jgi:prepilin-type N-terminal cleavage/methylation domain-containing protein/prepilin-type processing-associated H-X9-DG protein
MLNVFKLRMDGKLRYRMNKSRSRKTCSPAGFTLVELLVVISIIALLLAILMPALQKVRAQARFVVCKSDTSQLIKSFLLYGADYRDKLPPYSSWEKYTDPSEWWFCKVMPYMGDKKVQANRRFGWNFMRCPATIQQRPKSDVFLAPVDPTVLPFTVGVYYPKVFSLPTTTKNLIGTTYYMGGAKISTIKSSRLIAADCKSGYTWQSCIGDPENSNWNFSSSAGVDTDGDGIKDSVRGELSPGAGMGQYNGFAPRHNKNASAAFIDGSVRTVSVKDWVTNKGGIW